MFPRMCSQLPCMNMDETAVTSQPAPIVRQECSTSHGRKASSSIELCMWGSS